MSIVSAIAIYFVIWWLVLFAVLPIGVRTQQEEGQVEPGSAPSAPARPHMGLRLAGTTILAAIVFAALYLAWDAGLAEIVFPPRPAG